ncbi:glycoside hydrolase family 20 zincin-like fold domain-containing protein [Nonomuraea sp. NPDC050786]|uniref:glycoside hydrolase family 20 zincin-like fold domain-containing protein n=1 Tax=Nonomuraea sp. NPDC050786 TaxID=3154840 RepID=UPI0033DA9639
MDALDWIVPVPKKAAIGRSHVDLTRCRIQGTPAATTALTALRTALTPAPGPLVVEVRIDADAELPAEGYAPTAGETGVVIVGADPAGAFYGAQQLGGRGSGARACRGARGERAAPRHPAVRPGGAGPPRHRQPRHQQCRHRQPRHRQRDHQRHGLTQACPLRPGLDNHLGDARLRPRVVARRHAAHTPADVAP